MDITVHENSEFVVVMPGHVGTDIVANSLRVHHGRVGLGKAATDSGS